MKVEHLTTAFDGVMTSLKS